MKIKIVLFISILLLFLTACGGERSATKQHYTELGNIPRGLLPTSTILDKGLKEINRYRTNAGLFSLLQNDILSQVAQSHANYLIKNNLYTHIEDGTTPKQRVATTNYPHTDIAEDIYAGDVSSQQSIEILFSNIYHRLSFLDFGFDEIGLGFGSDKSYKYHNVYNYELGHKNNREKNTQNSPKIILWPYKNQKDVSPVFYEEKPDPLPECSVSGYPISIQFNPLKNGQITLTSFELLEENKIPINSKLLPHDGKLSQKEFVLMPLTRLKENRTYHVQVSYFDEDQQHTLSWDFHTKSNPYTTIEITQKGQTDKVKSNNTYYIYLPPKDCNDKFSSYTYSTSKGLTLTERMIDNNTIMIKAIGKGTIKIVPNNERSFTLLVE